MSGRLPTGELRNANVKFISLVDKAANRRRFVIFKAADWPGEGRDKADPEVEQVKGLFATLKAFFSGNAQKAEDAGEAGAPEKPEALDVQKAGRKISKARLEKLKRIQAILDEVLSEVDDGGEDEVEVTKQDLEQVVAAAVEKALEPIEARLKALEAEGAEDKGEGAEPSIEEVVKAAVETAVKPLAERLEVVEKARGIGNGIPTDEVRKSATGSVWGGVFV